MKKTVKNDNSAPYRTMGLDMVKAPSCPKCAPKGEKLASEGDLRCGKKK